MGRILTVDPSNPAGSVIDSIARTFREGGVVLYPTDTIYGLGCLPDRVEALGRIMRIKGRAERKGFLLLVPGSDWVEKLCVDIPPVFYSLADRFWPGPVTFLLPARPELPWTIRGERDLVGMRNPDSLYLQRLLEVLSAPLVSTSANLSGAEPPGPVSELKALLLDKVDLFVDAGDVDEPVPSTVVDLSVLPARVVREGRLGEEVRQALGESNEP